MLVFRTEIASDINDRELLTLRAFGLQKNLSRGAEFRLAVLAEETVGIRLQGLLTGVAGTAGNAKPSQEQYPKRGKL